LVATNAGGTSGGTLTPNNRFIVLETSGEGDSFAITILNTAAPPAGTPDPTAVSNEASSEAVSVLNTKAPPAGTADPTVVSNEADGKTVTVFNIANPPLGTLDPTAVSNESDSRAVSVLNTQAPPAGTADPTAVSNEAASRAVSVLNTQGPPAGTVDPTVVSNEADSPATTVYNSASSGNTKVSLSAAGALPPASTPVLRLTGASGADESSHLISGATATLSANVPNGFTGEVRFFINGVLFETARLAPFTITFTVPSGLDSLNLTAELHSSSGEDSITPSVRIAVVPDSRTEVTGVVADSAGHPVADRRVTLEVQGLVAEYFRFESPLSGLPDLSDRKPVTTTFVPGLNLKNPQRVFGADPLSLGLGPDYAARYRGEIQIGQGGGKYGFFLRAHRGARLSIDGAQVLETPQAGGDFAEADAAVPLGPGWHKIEIVYYEAVGAAWLDLTWALPGADRQPIPPQNLRARGEGRPAITNSAGEFRVPNVPASLDQVQVSIESGGAEPITSAPAKPSPSGITALGNITIGKL
jgi:hypothetical protein